MDVAQYIVACLHISFTHIIYIYTVYICIYYMYIYIFLVPAKDLPVLFFDWYLRGFTAILRIPPNP